MVSERGIGESIELARRNIGLKLLIPLGCVECLVPLTEARTLRSGKTFDFALKLLDLGHTREYSGS